MWCPFLPSFSKLFVWSWVSLWNSQTILIFPSFTHKETSPASFPPPSQHRTSLLKVHIEPHESFRQDTIQILWSRSYFDKRTKHTNINNTLDRHHKVMHRKNMLPIARFGMLQLYWSWRSIYTNINCVCGCGVHSCNGLRALGKGFI